MGTHVITFMDERRDGLRNTLLLSIILHAVAFVVAVTYTLLGFHLGARGPEWGSQDATHVGAVTSLPGIPLPTPVVTTPSQVASQNPGVFKTEPQPKEEPAPEAQQIPKFKDAVKPERLDRPNKRIQKTEAPPPDNAVPYGETGAPTMNYTQVVTAQGTGGLSVGQDNAFGFRWGYYVSSMKARISAEWLQSTISSNITTAPRVYVTFKILRDGSVTNVQITQGSGVPEVDRSAFRAILASNPLPPLPSDYSGSSVDVQFYFDFHR